MRRFVDIAYHRALLRSRLCWRIALTVFAAIVIVEAIILVPSARNFERGRFDRLEEIAFARVSTWLRLAAATPGSPPEDAGIVTTGGPVRGLALFDQAGRPLAMVGEQPRLRLETLADTSVRRPSRGSPRFDVTWGPERLGVPYRVVARLDSGAIPGELSAFMMRIGALVLVITVVVTSATMLLLGQSVLSPLLRLREKLMRAAKNPESADQYALPWSNPDELGDVIASFNDMSRHVAASIRATRQQEKALDELNRSLERRVRERTRDLEDAVAESERANQALTRSEERFRNVFKRSNDAIFVVDIAAAKIVDANPEAHRMLGYESEELLSLPVTAIHPDDGHAALGRFADLVARFGGARSAELTCRTKDGTDIPVEMSASMVDYGGQRAYLMLVRDITERREIEATLRGARDAAEAANRAKSEFLANMSHELRTPLNAIIGFAEIMEREMFAPLGDPRYREYAGDITESARHLLGIINDILDVAKAEAGKLELIEETVAFDALIDASLRMVGGRAEESGIAIRYERPTALPVLRGDERKLKQILVNLLTNAIKFTPPGGEVTIGVERDEAGGMAMTVTDTGIGIAEADLEHIMTPFAQVESAFNRCHEGTGLGLPLARALAELHGGGLKLESVAGRGTRATLRLPAERLRETVAKRA